MCKFENDHGKIKKRLILLPCSLCGGAAEAEKQFISSQKIILLFASLLNQTLINAQWPITSEQAKAMLLSSIFKSCWIFVHLYNERQANLFSQKFKCPLNRKIIAHEKVISYAFINSNLDESCWN
jgi:hypothetical protein